MLAEQPISSGFVSTSTSSPPVMSMRYASGVPGRPHRPLPRVLRLPAVRRRLRPTAWTRPLASTSAVEHGESGGIGPTVASRCGCGSKKLLGDNPDAIYCGSVIEPDRDYVIRGNLAGAVSTSFTVENGMAGAAGSHSTDAKQCSSPMARSAWSSPIATLASPIGWTPPVLPPAPCSGATCFQPNSPPNSKPGCCPSM